MERHEKINYVELPARDLAAVKTFYQTVFGWTFTDYGPDYCSFDGAGIDGGFFKSDQHAQQDTGSVLLVLYSTDLAATQTKIEQAGGKIVRKIFEFPGGRRFHFCDPNGNEWAVWSDR